MSTYSNAGLKELRAQLSKIQGKRNGLLLRMRPNELSNQLAKQVLEQGVLRRISLLAASVHRIFEILPPDTSDIPEKETLDLITLLLHANIFNTFGLLDCWAHVWVNEFRVLGRSGAPLRKSQIGLGSNHIYVRASLTPRLVKYLRSRDDWISRISKLRHSLAHRIPPYIPPHMVDPSKEKSYIELQYSRFSTLDQNERARIDSEIAMISHFKALYLYDLDKEPPIALHAQLISDFLTVEELADIFMAEILGKKEE